MCVRRGGAARFHLAHLSGLELGEIEELASSVGNVVVQASGCLGNCSQAPNALVVSDKSENIFARLCDLSQSAKVVERASLAELGGSVPTSSARKVVDALMAKNIIGQYEAFGEAQPGLDQYAIGKYGEALECVPRVLAEVAGLNLMYVMPLMTSARALASSTLYVPRSHASQVVVVESSWVAW